MTHWFRRYGPKAAGLIFIFLSLATVCRGQSDDFQIGGRGGVSFSPGIKRFQQVEGVGRWQLPWHWRIYSGLYARPYLDLSAGALWNKKNGAFVGTLGPGVELHFGQFPVFLEGGSSPTLLGLDNFGGENFGYRLQFTSHLGIEWAVTKHFSLDWRLQHMSDAGIAEPNPGLNMQMVSASYNF